MVVAPLVGAAPASPVRPPPRTGMKPAPMGHADPMADLPLHLLTDAGFTPDEANGIVKHLIQGVDLHDDAPETDRLDVEALPPEKKDAVQRFTLAVAGDA